MVSHSSIPVQEMLPGALPISTAFTESAVNEVVAKRRNNNQPMRWNRYTAQPFLTVRVHALVPKAARTDADFGTEKVKSYPGLRSSSKRAVNRLAEAG